VRVICGITAGGGPWRDTSNYDWIRTVIIEDGVTGIGAWAFCSEGFSSLILGGDLTTIGNGAFAYCRNLKSVCLEPGIVTIGASAFSDCTSLTSVAIPASVTAIGSDAFWECNALENVYIESLAAWCDIDFDGSASNPLGYAQNLYVGAKEDPVEELELPSGITQIGKCAFCGYTGMTKVTVPYGVTQIGSDAFSGCTGLTEVTIPQSVTQIGDYAFADCTALAQVTIPEGLTGIEYGTFTGCTGLTSVTFPDSVTRISGSAFFGCAALADVTYSGTRQQWNSIVVQEKNQALSTATIHAADGDFVIDPSGSYLPDHDYAGQCGDALYWKLNYSTLTIYGSGAMYDYALGEAPWADHSIYTCNFEGDITSIGSYAFAELSCFSIVLPDSITDIGEYAFYGCTSLSSLTLGKGVKNIGSGMLSQCNRISTLNYNAACANDVESGAGILASVAPDYGILCCIGAEVEYIPSHMFSNMASDGFLYLTFQPDGKLRSIGDYAFSGNKNLSIEAFPETLQTIGAHSFENCSLADGLPEIPGAVTQIGDYAFSGCSKVGKATLVGGGRIGDYAFYGSDISDLHTDRWLERIGTQAFGSCASLNTVSINTDMPGYIAEDAFDGVSAVCYGAKGCYDWPEIAENAANYNYGGTLEWHILSTTYLNGGLTFTLDRNGLLTISGEGYYYTGNAPLGEAAPFWEFVQCAVKEIVAEEGLLGVYGWEPFANCTQLKKVTFPEGMQFLYGNTFLFNGSGKLETLVLPDSLLYFETRLAPLGVNISLPPNLVSIDIGQFEGNYAITEITVPESMTMIPAQSFKGCSALKKLVLPATLTNIQMGAFSSCPLTDIYYGGTPEQWEAITIGYGNSSLFAATLHFNSDGTEAPAVEELVLCRLPDQRNYLEDEQLDLTGLELSLVYSDGTTVRIYNGYTVSGYDPAVLGEQTITVTCQGHTVTFCVTVSQEEEGEDPSEGEDPIQPPAEEKPQGVCGSELTWILDNGTLTVSGTGAMYNYNGDAPWLEYAESIQKVILEEGVYCLGAYAFMDCGNLTEVSLPDSLNYISGHAFYGCSSLATVNFPNTLTHISSYAFYGCAALESVSFGENIFSLGSYVFANCTGLTEVLIPENVTTIGEYAFSGCSGLRSLTVHGGSNTLGNQAFSGCTMLTQLYFNANIDRYYLDSDHGIFANAGANGSGVTVTVGPNVTRIPACLFSSGSPKIISVDFAPNSSCTTIGDHAFAYCTDLQTVRIPDSVTDMGFSAFIGCTSLKKLTIGNGLASVAPYLCYGCTGLTELELGSSITTIEEQAFYDCASLTEVTLPDSVTTVGMEAFYNCTGLSRLTLGTGLTRLDLSAFYGCTGLTEIYYNAAAVQDLYSDNYVFSKAGQNGSGITLTVGPAVTVIPDHLFCPSLSGDNAPKLTAVQFAPGSICTAIGYDAFYRCKELASMVLADSVTTVEAYAFGGCTGLTKLTIGKGMVSLSQYAFSGCTGLQEVTYLAASMNSCYRPFYETKSAGFTVTVGAEVQQIPEKLFYDSAVTQVRFAENSTCHTIGEQAFYSCSKLTEIYIPESVTQIGYSAFDGSYCISQVHITDLAAWCGIHFESANANPLYMGGKLYLDGVLVSGNVVIPAGTAAIGQYAFANYQELTGITLPDTVTAIDQYAFMECAGLTCVNLGNGVTTLNYGAFYSCGNLKEIQIPASVTYIAEDAFGSCSIAAYRVDPDNQAYCSDAYGVLFDKGQTKLLMVPGSISGSYVIPSTVTQITAGAFENCTGLTSVTIPGTVESIEYETFYGCTGLTEVLFGDGIKQIGWMSFQNCTSLVSIVIPDSVESIGPSAFNGCSALESICVDPENAAYCTDASGVLYNKEMSKIVAVPAMLSGSYAIAPGVTYIASQQFCGCAGLTQVIIPNSVTEIYWNAFGDCTGLTSVQLGSGITYIDECAFNNCNAITDVYYAGSQEEWANIDLYGYGNGALINANIHYNHGRTEGVVKQPKDQTVTLGSKASFTVEAIGEGLSYRWQYSKDGGETWINATSSMSGYKSDTLVLTATKARNGYLLRCKVTNQSGNAIFSEAAMLTVEEAITFIEHPQAETVKLGNRAAFTVEAEGEIKSYQWQYQMVEGGPWWNCTKYTQGYNTTELNVIAAEKRQGFLYRCRITDSYGNKYYSNTAELTVDIPESYAVLSQPKDTWVMPGKKTTFHIETQGEGLTYQWEYHKGVDKSGPEYYWIAMGSTTGCKTDTLTIAGVSGSTNRDGWAYRCVVTDPNGYVYTTDHAFLYVASAQIDAQPEDANVAPGEKAFFHAEVSGEVVKYQWQYSKDGGKSWYSSSSATQGYNTDTLIVASVSGSTNRNGFLYRCIITDSEGDRLITDPAKLTVE